MSKFNGLELTLVKSVTLISCKVRSISAENLPENLVREE